MRIDWLQNYCFRRNFNNNIAPIMAGNNKLTSHIMVLTQINIKLLLYHGSSNNTISCPRMTNSVMLMTGIILNAKKSTPNATHKSKKEIGI